MQWTIVYRMQFKVPNSQGGLKFPPCHYDRCFVLYGPDIGIKLLFFDLIPQNLGLLSSSPHVNSQCNINEP